MAKRAGLLIATLVSAAVATGFAFLLSIDADGYRDEIAGAFRVATGRALVIAGDVDLSVSLSPAVVAEKIAVANAGWGSRPAMATVERAEIQVELIPLIVGDIRIARLVLVEPDILLETGRDGTPNWRFSKSRGRPAGKGAASPIPVVQRVEIVRGRLTYRNGKSGETIRVRLDDVAIGARSRDGALTLRADGAWNRSPFALSGAVDTFADFASGRPVGVDAVARAFGLEARLAGTVAEPRRPAGLDLLVAVEGAGLSTLAAALGRRLPTPGPIALAARVRGGAGRIDLDRIRLTLGSSRLSGRIALARRGARPRLTGKLVSERLDLTGLLASPGGAREPAAPRAAGPRRVFPDDPLPLAWLDAADLDLAFVVARLIVRPLPFDAVSTRIRLDRGALRLDPLSASVAASRVDGALRLDARRSPPALALALRAPDLDLGRLLQESGAAGLFEGKARLRAELRGSGRSIAALMAGLDGEILLRADRGRLNTQAFHAAVGGAVPGTLFPRERGWTAVNCAASSIAVAKGRASSRATVIDTEHAIVAVRGGVDLARETLRLTVAPRPRTATPNPAVPVYVRGTLADPELRPEAGAALEKLGGLAAFALFPPAALAGLGELGGGGMDCVETAATRRLPGAGSASPGKAVRAPKEGAEGVVRGMRGGGRNRPAPGTRK
ncbi:MAG: AsmA family protein [Defluviicoccus sp.]|nr:AsmA family protein [Defluviicoccus sp.]